MIAKAEIISAAVKAQSGISISAMPHTATRSGGPITEPIQTSVRRFLVVFESTIFSRIKNVISTGTMVTAISKRIREEYKTPWLNLAFDGLEQGTTETRLEAFMYQAKQHKKAKLEEKIPDGLKSKNG